MDHQNWKPTVWNKTKRPKITHPPNHVSKAKKIETKAEDGDYNVEKVSHTLKLQIQKARQANKLSQKELATKCNLPLSTIKEYENGKATPNPSILSKMSRILGVKLKKVKSKQSSH